MLFFRSVCVCAYIVFCKQKRHNYYIQKDISARLVWRYGSSISTLTHDTMDPQLKQAHLIGFQNASGSTQII
jgi:hypothetical protein